MVSIGNKDEFLLELVNHVELVERWQYRVPLDDPSEWRDYLARGVRTNAFRLGRILDSGKEIGLLVYKVDVAALREFVIVALYCEPLHHRGIIDFIAIAAENIARQENCDCIRFHTMRPGLIVQAKKRGYKVSEVVLRKSLT